MDKYKNINSDNYDHLWEFQGGHYLLCSVYVDIYSDNYKKYFIASGVGDRHSFFYIKSRKKKGVRTRIQILLQSVCRLRKKGEKAN
jgi:hypothetical protein